MKKNNIILISFFLLSFCCYAKESKNMPEWVLFWQRVYPESEFIAQKGTGKKSEEAKNTAAANLSQFFETSITSTLETNYNSLEVQSNGKYNMQTNQEIARKTKVETSTVLNAVEYTEPWYNKKDKTWHCVAFISRKNIWNKYEPTLRLAKDTFRSFYTKAEQESGCFEKIKAFSLAATEGLSFMESVTYAQFLSKPLTDSYCTEEILILSNLARIIQEEKNNCSLYIDVTGDSGNVIYSILLNSFTNSGFTVIGERATAKCIVEAKILIQTELNDELIIFSPSIILEIKEGNQNVFSYAKDCSRIKAYTEASGNKKSIESISKMLGQGFLEEFNSALSGKK